LAAAIAVGGSLKSPRLRLYPDVRGCVNGERRLRLTTRKQGKNVKRGHVDKLPAKSRKKPGQFANAAQAHRAPAASASIARLAIAGAESV
jgi:hypothetical protein